MTPPHVLFIVKNDATLEKNTIMHGTFKIESVNQQRI